MSARTPEPSPWYHEFLPEVATVVPQLRPIVAEHLEDNFGEVLPHLLMHDVQQWAVAHVGDERASVARLVTALADAYDRGDPDVSNCVSLSFLDGLPPGEQGVRGLLMPSLAEQLSRVESG